MQLGLVIVVKSKGATICERQRKHGKRMARRIWPLSRPWLADDHNPCHLHDTMCKLLGRAVDARIYTSDAQKIQY
jgi:hypothetical protein